MPTVILPRVRDPRFVTVRSGGILSDPDHHALALWAATCAEHVLDLFESAGSAMGAARSCAGRPGRRVRRGSGRECRWQRDRPPPSVRDLVLDDQRLRNDLCWSVFDC